MQQLTIPEEYKDVQGCVYLIFYGRKYIAVMGKTFIRSFTSIQNDLARFLKGRKEGSDKNNLYVKFYEYIISNQDQDEFSVEMISMNNNPYYLLKTCHEVLNNGDKDCLNSNRTPYLSSDIQKPPKNRRSTLPLFINRGYYLNYHKWKKKHSA
jgi:hypothetical protein